MRDPTAEPPLINTFVEDMLAHATSETERTQMLGAMMTLCAEYMAREIGRSRTRHALLGLDTFIRDAQPARPWEE
jgi:hypothetical protein